MGKRTVQRIRAHGDDEVVNHIVGPIGNDYALCGMTLDGDDMVVESHEVTQGRITCPKCWAVIEFCRTIRDRKPTPAPQDRSKPL